MYEELRNELTELCRRCYSRGHVSATNGNLSARTPDGKGILIKASGISFADITPADMLFVGPGEDALCCDTGKPAAERGKRPSIELHLHAQLYPISPDIGAVVHLHSPYATALSFHHDEIPLVVLEARHILARVPVIPEYEAGSAELADAVRSTFSQAGTVAAVLAHHGPVAIGKNLRDAYNNADTLEHNAHIATLAALYKP